MKTYKLMRFLEDGDFDHHGFLTEGKTAETLAESALIAANIAVEGRGRGVLRRLTEMEYLAKVKKGDTLTVKSRIAAAGESALVFYTEIASDKEGYAVARGYTVFDTVTVKREPLKHGLQLDEPADEAEAETRRVAAKLL